MFIEVERIIYAHKLVIRSFNNQISNRRWRPQQQGQKEVPTGTAERVVHGAEGGERPGREEPENGRPAVRAKDEGTRSKGHGTSQCWGGLQEGNQHGHKRLQQCTGMKNFRYRSFKRFSGYF